MTLGYTKWTPEQDKSRNIIQDGQYQAVISEIIAKMTKGGKIDKKGNPIPSMKMLEIELLVQDMTGRERKVKDWVLLESEMSWKFFHLCIATGHQDQYDNDTIELRMLLNKVVIIDLKSKKGQNQEGVEVMRNYVADYLPPADTTNDFKDCSEIPF